MDHMGVGLFLGPVEEVIAEIFLLVILGEKEVTGKLRKILPLSDKSAGNRLPTPTTTSDE